MVSKNGLLNAVKFADPFARPNIREDTRSNFGVLIGVLCVAGLAVYTAIDVVSTPITTVVQSRTSEGEAFTLEVTCNPQSPVDPSMADGLKGCWVSTSYKTEISNDTDVLNVNARCRSQDACIFIPEDTKRSIFICYSDDQIDGIRVAWRAPASVSQPFGFNLDSATYGPGSAPGDDEWRRIDKKVRVGLGTTIVVPSETRNDTIDDGTVLKAWFNIPISNNIANLAQQHQCQTNPTYGAVQSNLTYALLRVFPSYQSTHAFIEVDPLNVIGNLGGTANIFFAVGLIIATLYRVVIVQKCGKAQPKDGTAGKDGKGKDGSGGGGGFLEMT